MAPRVPTPVPCARAAIGNIYTVTGINCSPANSAFYLPKSGGWVLDLTPAVRFEFQASLGMVANLQIPVYQDLYENQNENAVFNLTFRYDVF